MQNYSSKIFGQRIISSLADFFFMDQPVEKCSLETVLVDLILISFTVSVIQMKHNFITSTDDRKNLIKFNIQSKHNCFKL